MKVRDIMSINPIIVSPDDKINHVVQIFEKNRIGSVFVVQSGKLVGIVTRTMIKKRSPKYSENVSEIMSTNVYSIHPDADVKEAESKIYRQRINGLAVVEANHLCGIITRYDIQTRATRFNASHEETRQYSQPTFKQNWEYQKKPIQKNRIVQPFHHTREESIIEKIFAIVFIGVIFGSFLSNLIFPFILLGFHTNMHYILGNPKPLYFYDIDSSCNNNDENNIVSGLNYLSSVTGINFIRIPPPFALLLGHIDYSCQGVSILGASGESMGGHAGISYFIISWNQVKLLDTNKEVVIHETLHSLGFDHSENPTSIMYPIQRGSSNIDLDIVNFLKTFYVNNPFAYLNIITLNMLTGSLLVLLILSFFFR